MPCRRSVAYAGALYFSMMLTAATPKGPTALSTCTFAGDSAVTGSCGRLFDQTPEMMLRRAHSVAGGVCRSSSSPRTVWYGDMTDQGYPNAPIQLQIYDTASGILQTIYGWFPVTHYRTTPRSRELSRPRTNSRSEEELWIEAKRSELRHGLTRRQRIFILEKLVGLNDKDAALAAGYSLSVAENTKRRVWKQRVRNEFERLRCVTGCHIPENRRTGIKPG